MGRDGQEPGFEGAAPLIFTEKSLAIRRRGETIRPEIGDQILGFGGTRSSRTKDRHHSAMVAATQLRRGRAISAQNALRKAQILLVTGWGRMRHSDTEDEVLPLERQYFRVRTFPRARFWRPDRL